MRPISLLLSGLSLKTHVALTHNDIHSGQAGNFSPDKGGQGAVDIYWYAYCEGDALAGTHLSLAVTPILKENRSGPRLKPFTTTIIKPWHRVTRFVWLRSVQTTRDLQSSAYARQFGDGKLLGWQAGALGGTGYEKYSK